MFSKRDAEELGKLEGLFGHSAAARLRVAQLAEKEKAKEEISIPSPKNGSHTNGISPEKPLHISPLAGNGAVVKLGLPKGRMEQGIPDQKIVFSCLIFRRPLLLPLPLPLPLLLLLSLSLFGSSLLFV